MDNDTLRAAFHAHKEGQKTFTRRMAITIALLLDETPKAVVQRLEALHELRPGSWRWFEENGGIQKWHVDKVKQDLARQAEEKENGSSEPRARADQQADD